MEHEYTVRWSDLGNNELKTTNNRPFLAAFLHIKIAWNDFSNLKRCTVQYLEPY